VSMHQRADRNVAAITPKTPHNGGRDPCPAGRRQLTAGSAPTDDGALRLQYAMAIVRLVNGVADAAQRGRTAVSVAGLAAQAGQHPGS
jgi:Las1-like